MFWRSTIEIVIVDLENLDFAEMGAIGWTLLVLEIVAAEMEITNLLRW